MSVDRRRTFLAICKLAALTLAACSNAPTIPRAASPTPRIVSVDYCADQAVLAYAPRTAIAAVSREAASDPWFAGPASRGIPRTNTRTEDILALRPTLVVQSFASDPALQRALNRLGIATVTLPYSGTLSEVRSNIEESARLLGRTQDDAARIVARYDIVMAQTRRTVDQGHVLYVTPGNVTAGLDTLVGQLMRHVGLMTMRRDSGWGSLPLEQLAVTRPRHIVQAFHDSAAYRQDHWAASSHPVVERVMRDGHVTQLPGSTVACGTALLADAALMLNGTPPRRAGAALSHGRTP